jgi:RNA polymerase sigma-70 factor (ECF subfamily)
VDTIPAAQAVEVLIHQYGKLVFHTIYGLTNDWEESQDLTQDTFHQALRAIDAARAASGEQFHARAWLLRIALNTVRMQQRRRSLFRFIPFSHLHEGKQESQSEMEGEAVSEQAARVQPAGYGAAATDDPAELIAEQDAVQRTMAKLPETLRVCLLLSVVGGLSSAEIAEMLDLKEAAVRQRLARARKQFQQTYAYESGEEVLDMTQPAVKSAATTHQTTEERAELHMPSDKPQHLMLRAHPTTWRSYA